MQDDGHLIDAALAGQPEAFGQLVRRYQDRLYHSMVRVTGCPAEAEDVVQDAFVQAFTKLDRFQRKSQFFTWLYRIAFNTSVSRHRKRKPRVSIEQQRETIGLDPVDNSPPADAALQHSEQVAQLEAACNSCPTINVRFSYFENWKTSRTRALQRYWNYQWAPFAADCIGGNNYTNS